MHKVSLLFASSWRYQPCTASCSDAGTERQVLGKHTSESCPQPKLLLIDAWVPATTSLSTHFIFVKLFATLIYYFLLFIILLLLIKTLLFAKDLLQSPHSHSFKQEYGSQHISSPHCYFWPLMRCCLVFSPSLHPKGFVWRSVAGPKRLLQTQVHHTVSSGDRQEPQEQCQARA